jgi:hypothetical protein
MATVARAEASPVRDSVPLAVKKLRQMQDQSCERISSSIDAISSDLTGPLEREDRLELAAAITDVAAGLRSLIQQKIDAGYFDGVAESSQHSRDRAAHLLSDYRRLLNELRAAQQETANGRLRKACRQLDSWLGHFRDLAGRESEVISELWQS